MDDHKKRALAADKGRLQAAIPELRQKQADARAKGDAEAEATVALAIRSTTAELERVEEELNPGARERFEAVQRFRNREQMPTAGSTLAQGQSMRDAIGNTLGSLMEPQVSLSGLVRGLGLGDWRGVTPEVKAMVLSGGAAAAVPGYVTAGIVDIAREQSILFRAGARLLPIDVPSAKVARLTSEPAVQWEPEAADRDLTDGAWTFDAAELTAATAWLYTTMGVEVAEDALGLEETIHNSFSAQLALAFDQAGFAGDGVDKPVGIINMGAAQDHIIEMNAVGALANYTPFVRAMGLVKANHHEPTSIVMPVETWVNLNTLQDQDDNPLQAPRAYGELTEYVSGFMPADGGVGTNEHTVTVGDLSAITVGVRTDLTIEVSRLGAGFKKGAIEVRGYVRFGTYLTRPGAIAVLRGITVPVAG